MRKLVIVGNSPETRLLPVTTDTPTYALPPDYPGIYKDYAGRMMQRTFLGNITTGHISPVVEDVYAYTEEDPATGKAHTRLSHFYRCGDEILERSVAIRILTGGMYELFVNGDFIEEDDLFGREHAGEKFLWPEHQVLRLAIEKGFIDEEDVLPIHISERSIRDPAVRQRALDIIERSKSKEIDWLGRVIDIKPKRAP